MLRPLLLAISVLWSAFNASAQYYNVGLQSIGENPGENYFIPELYSSSLIGNHAFTNVLEYATAGQNDWSAEQSIPFSFQFAGAEVNSFKVCKTGVLTFKKQSLGEVPGSSNSLLPHADIPDSSACIWGVDFGAGSYVLSKAVGTSPNRQLWVIWNDVITPEMSGQSSLFIRTSWAIVLEESSNNIYMVDMNSYGDPSEISLSVGVQVDSLNAISMDTIVSGHASSGFEEKDNSYYAFIDGVRPERDIFNMAITHPKLIHKDSVLQVEGRIINAGSETVSTYAIRIWIDSTYYSHEFVGLNLSTSEEINYSIALNGVPLVEKHFTLSTQVWTLNDTNDQVTENDVRSMRMTAHPDLFKKTSLVEYFTSRYMFNPSANDSIKSLSQEYASNANVVCYPIFYDPYTQPFSNDRRSIYDQTNALWSPFVNGSLTSVDYSWKNELLGQKSFYEIDFVDLIATPVLYHFVRNDGLLDSIDFVNVQGRIEVNSVMHMEEAVGLLTVITEDSSDYQGSDVSVDLAKKMPWSAFPRPTLIDSNSALEALYTLFIGTYRLPNLLNGDDELNSSEHCVEDFQNLSMVAWLTDSVTGEVVQSEKLHIPLADTLTNLSIDTVDGKVVYIISNVSYEVVHGKYYPLGNDAFPVQSTLSLYPNPVNSVLYISGLREQKIEYSIYDVLGRRVKTSRLNDNTINVADLTPGVYHLKLHADILMPTLKFVVD
ncbi:MAG: T9SS type A sorting domain-containing protein [Flavobacteriales bacterium]|nr:T9SS type A sorting domain-containing protein [Flavobacteriales bacterium]